MGSSPNHADLTLHFARAGSNGMKGRGWPVISTSLVYADHNCQYTGLLFQNYCWEEEGCLELQHLAARFVNTDMLRFHTSVIVQHHINIHCVYVFKKILAVRTVHIQ